MGVKPTVVSIKKYNSLKEAYYAQGRMLTESEAQVARLQDRVRMAVKIRQELKWFMGECEKSMAYHDPVKGDSWKKKNKEPEYFGFLIHGKMQALIAALTGHHGDKKNGTIIRLAVGIANLSMMMAYNAAFEDGVYPEPVPF